MPETPFEVFECDCSTGSPLDFTHNVLLRAVLEGRRVEIHNNAARQRANDERYDSEEQNDAAAT